MMPEEVRRMDPNRFVLLTENERPIFGTKLRHFETAPFKAQAESARQAVPDVPELALTADLALPSGYTPAADAADSSEGEPGGGMSALRSRRTSATEVPATVDGGAKAVHTIAAEDLADNTAGGPPAALASFPRPEEAFELFESALDEIVGRTRDAILSDQGSTGTRRARQPRGLGPHPGAMPHDWRGGDRVRRSSARGGARRWRCCPRGRPPSQTRSQEAQPQQKAQGKMPMSRAAALVGMGRRVDKPRQRQNLQRSTSRP